MNRNDAQALLTVALHAAASDAGAGPVERQSVRQALAELAHDFGAGFSRAAAEEAALADAVELLRSPATAPLAFEVAACICSANRLRTNAETLFLADLGRRLRLTQPQIAGTAATADMLATLPLADGPRPTILQHGHPDGACADSSRAILDAALRTATLQALCHPLAALAIVAIQQTLIARVAADCGNPVDRVGMRALAAAAGLGFSGEFLHVLGRCLARTIAADEAASLGSDGMDAFCATYAIGHAVRRAHGQCPPQDAAALRGDFDRLARLAGRRREGRAHAAAVRGWQAALGDAAFWRAGAVSLRTDVPGGALSVGCGTLRVALAFAA